MTAGRAARAGPATQGARLGRWGALPKLSYTAPAALAARYELSDEPAARLAGNPDAANTLLDE